MVDFVTAVKILLATGEIITADSSQNKDLFYALRGGGGGNWGIVLEYTIELIPVVPFVTSVFWLPPVFSHYPNIIYDLFRVTREYFTNPDNTPLPNNFNLYFGS